MLVGGVLATFWLRSRRWCGAQLTLFDALEVLSIPILVPSNTKSHGSEYSPEQRGVVSSGLKADGELQGARARRDAGCPRPHSSVGRDETSTATTHTHGATRAHPAGEKVTSLQIYRLVPDRLSAAATP